jgi:RNA polymerase sigma-70 factor, ECF subfamily
MRYTHAISGAAPSWRSFSNETDDQMLVELAAAGDQRALRVLFARHNVRVLRFVVRVVGDPGIAEDLVNEVFLDIWRKAHQFEGRSQVLTWILGIARYKALSALRRRPTCELNEAIIELIEDPADNPEVITHKKNVSIILRDCLSQLPAPHREIVDLVYYHGQSIEEVAEIIGVPQNTAKTRMFYARKRLAKLIAARGFAQDGSFHESPGCGHIDSDIKGTGHLGPAGLKRARTNS